MFSAAERLLMCANKLIRAHLCCCCAWVGREIAFSSCCRLDDAFSNHRQALLKRPDVPVLEAAESGSNARTTLSPKCMNEFVKLTPAHAAAQVAPSSKACRRAHSQSIGFVGNAEGNEVQTSAGRASAGPCLLGAGCAACRRPGRVRARRQAVGCAGVRRQHSGQQRHSPLSTQ